MKERLMTIFFELQSRGLVTSQKKFAEIIGENANGLSDLKAERKKITYDHVKKLHSVLPDLNPNWLFEGKGDMYINRDNENKDGVSEPMSGYGKEEDPLDKFANILHKMMTSYERDKERLRQSEDHLRTNERKLFEMIDFLKKQIEDKSGSAPPASKTG